MRGRAPLHRLPDAASCIGKPVLELLLVNPRLLYQQGLVLRGGIGVGDVLGRQQPGPERGDGTLGELPLRFRAVLFRVGGDRSGGGGGRGGSEGGVVHGGCL